MNKYNDLIQSAGLGFFEDHGSCEACVNDVTDFTPCTCEDNLRDQLGIMSRCGLIRQASGMTQREEFEHNKKIAVDSGLISGVIEYGQDDEFIGMVYFRDTSFKDLRDQRHFAHALDFINHKERSERIFEELLKGEYK